MPILAPLTSADIALWMRRPCLLKCKSVKHGSNFRNIFSTDTSHVRTTIVGEKNDMPHAFYLFFIFFPRPKRGKQTLPAKTVFAPPQAKQQRHAEPSLTFDLNRLTQQRRRLCRAAFGCCEMSTAGNIWRCEMPSLVCGKVKDGGRVNGWEREHTGRTTRHRQNAAAICYGMLIVKNSHYTRWHHNSEGIAQKKKKKWGCFYESIMSFVGNTTQVNLWSI